MAILRLIRLCLVRLRVLLLVLLRVAALLRIALLLVSPLLRITLLLVSPLLRIAALLLVRLLHGLLLHLLLHGLRTRLEDAAVIRLEHAAAILRTWQRCGSIHTAAALHRTGGLPRQRLACVQAAALSLHIAGLLLHGGIHITGLRALGIVHGICGAHGHDLAGSLGILLREGIIRIDLDMIHERTVVLRLLKAELLEFVLFFFLCLRRILSSLGVLSGFRSGSFRSGRLALSSFLRLCILRDLLGRGVDDLGGFDALVLRDDLVGRREGLVHRDLGGFLDRNDQRCLLLGILRHQLRRRHCAVGSDVDLGIAVLLVHAAQQCQATLAGLADLAVSEADGDELAHAALTLGDHCHDRVIFGAGTHELTSADLDTGNAGIDLFRICHQNAKLSITRGYEVRLQLADVIHQLDRKIIEFLVHGCGSLQE